MKLVLTLLGLGLGFPLVAEPNAKLVLPEHSTWTGQRTPFFIELRAEGSFSGSANFDIPQIPRTVVIKVGNPVLSSETTDGEEVFVQRHEFALFSQADGTLSIPPITCRFSHRKGYTGPTFDAAPVTGSAKISLKRPAGSDSAFLITTENLTVTETWDPEPAAAEAGAVFKRTITQSAKEMTGMAFAPVNEEVPEGVRIYPPKVSVNDMTDRGSLSGERRETITYLFETAGIHTLPELRYTWWNPKTETFGSRVLPAQTFEITAPPQLAAADDNRPSLFWWCLLLLPAPFIWKRHQLANLARAVSLKLYPLEKRAHHRLIRACRQNDAQAAHQAWVDWRNLQPSISPKVQEAALDLQRQLFGPEPNKTWNGSSLIHALKNNPKASQPMTATHGLPPLNP